MDKLEKEIQSLLKDFDGEHSIAMLLNKAIVAHMEEV